MPKTPSISIELLCVGKLKGAANQYLQSGIMTYVDRLKPYCKFSVTELPDEKIRPGVADEAIKAAEGERILAYLLNHADYACVLSEHSKTLDSPGFAQALAKHHPGLNALSQGKNARGGAHMVVVIGGALGLSPAVLSAADWTLSLSPMTFPHLMVRLLFVEQLYRAFRIINNEPYHK